MPFSIAAPPPFPDRTVLLGNAVAPPLLFYSPEGRIDLPLEALAQGRASFITCSNAGALLRAAERAFNGAAIVTYAAGVDSTAIGALQLVRHRFRALPLLLITPADAVRDACAARLSAVAAAVRPDFVVADRADGMHHAMEALLCRANQQSTAGRILAMVDREHPDLDARLRDFIGVAARAPRSLRTVGAMAEVTGLSVRSLERRWREAGLPPAREIAGWILVARATWMLQDPECRLKRVVRWLPFPEEGAVGARFRRYAGRSPMAMRETDALTRLVEDLAPAFRNAALGGGRMERINDDQRRA